LKIQLSNFSKKITKTGSHKNNLLYMQLSTNILVFYNHWTGGLSSSYNMVWVSESIPGLVIIALS